MRDVFPVTAKNYPSARVEVPCGCKKSSPKSGPAAPTSADEAISNTNGINTFYIL
jgi:hypothetical protein